MPNEETDPAGTAPACAGSDARAVVAGDFTVVLGLATFATRTFRRWRLDIVAAVVGGGVLGLLRALAPGPSGGALS